MRHVIVAKDFREGFVEMMRSLSLTMPTHITEALRTNMSGGKTVSQLLAKAAASVPFMSLAELKARVESAEDDLIVLDVRERDAYERGHIPGARFRIIPTLWGHLAGAGLNPADIQLIEAEIKALLAS